MPIKKKQIKNQDKDFKSLQEEIDDLEWFIEDFSTFLPLAVCTINSFGIITNINKAFELLTGYSTIEIVREKIEKVFLDDKELAEAEAKAKKDNIFQTELSVLCKNGKSIPVSLSIAARKTRDGEFIGHFVALTDITELKELQTNLEEQVAEKTKELQEELGALEKFTKLTIGRELKMVELKNKIKELEAKQ